MGKRLSEKTFKMIDADDVYVEFFRFQATECSQKKAMVEYKEAEAKEIDEHKQILSVELQKGICLYLYQHGEDYIWIGTVGDQEFSIMDPACAFSDNPPKYSFQVLESSFEFIILVANEASTDIGVIAFAKEEETWQSWSLNEGAGATLPIKDGSDTFPKRIWLSFDSTQWITGFTQDSPKIPPSPVLNIELNTGDSLAYQCVRMELKDNDLFYSKMTSAKIDSEKAGTVNNDEISIPTLPEQSESLSQKTSIAKDAEEVSAAALKSSGFSFSKISDGKDNASTPLKFSFVAAAKPSEENDKILSKPAVPSVISLPKKSPNQEDITPESKSDTSSKNLNQNVESAATSSFSFGNAISKPSAFSFSSNKTSPFGAPIKSDIDNPFSVKSNSSSGFGSGSVTNNPFAAISSSKDAKKESLQSAFSSSKQEDSSALKPTTASIATPVKAPVFSFGKHLQATEKDKLESAMSPSAFSSSQMKESEKGGFSFASVVTKKGGEVPLKTGIGLITPEPAKIESAKSLFSFTQPASTEPAVKVDPLFSIPTLQKTATKPSLSSVQQPFESSTKLSQKDNSAVKHVQTKIPISKSVEEKNQILVDKFDEFYNDLDADMKILSDVFKSVKEEIVAAGTPKTLQNPTLGDLSKMQVQIEKISESRAEENSSREKLYESTMRLKHAGALLATKQEEIESRIESLRRGKAAISQQQSQFGRKLSPEAEMLQEQLEFKRNRVENDLELSLKIAEDLKSNKTRANNYTLLKIANTTSQIRRSIAAIQRDLDLTETTLNMLALDFNDENLATAQSKNPLRGKKSFSFGLTEDDLFADDKNEIKVDISNNIDFLALVKLKKDLFQKISIRPVVVHQVQPSVKSAHKPIPIKEWQAKLEIAKKPEISIESEDGDEIDDDYVEVEKSDSQIEAVDYETASRNTEERDQAEEEFEDFLSEESPSPVKIAGNAKISTDAGPNLFAESAKRDSNPSFSFAAEGSSFTSSKSFFTQATKPLEVSSPVSIGTTESKLPSSVKPFTFTTPNSSPAVKADSKPFSFANSSPAVKADSKPFSFTTISSEKKSTPSFSFTPKKTAEKQTVSSQPSKPSAEVKTSKLREEIPIVTQVDVPQKISYPMTKNPTPSLEGETNEEVQAQGEGHKHAITSMPSPSALSEKASPLVSALESQANVETKSQENSTHPKIAFEQTEEQPSFTEDPTFPSGDAGGISAILKSENVTPASKSPVISSSVIVEKISTDNNEMADDDVDNDNAMEEEKPGEETQLSFSGFGGFQTTPQKAINPMFGVSPSADSGKSVSAFGTGGSFGQSTSAFGQPAQSVSPFGQPQNSSPFGSSSKSTFGQQSTTASVFGQKSSTAAFGSSPAPNKPSAFGSSSPSPAFGQPAFGSPQPKPSFGQTAFGSTTVTTATFGQSGFASSTANQSGFGQTGFGSSAASQPAFGQSAFGSSAAAQPAFGQSGFGQAPATPFATIPTYSSGFAGFASQANQPTSFAAVAKNSGNAPAYAAGQSSAFGSGQGGFGQAAFGQSSFGQSSFGQQQTQSAFGNSAGGGTFGAQSGATK